MQVFIGNAEYSCGCCKYLSDESSNLDLIIGLAVGLGGFVLLVIIILIIVCCCCCAAHRAKKNRKDNVRQVDKQYSTTQPGNDEYSTQLPDNNR